ncbi:hypothetical protein B0T24DRAFT_600725 [Lasiosphaeria ovina]|uniref:Uncharacterized protein n=1 Tax=Lasiosphaeria ovina TaxID=92902 RepID=A0AAE0NIT4_9PEZI|nr:hypothetical protein B0T24DRAFT_600725 [Lasiosphaeria ovina]
MPRAASASARSCSMTVFKFAAPSLPLPLPLAAASLPLPLPLPLLLPLPFFLPLPFPAAVPFPAAPCVPLRAALSVPLRTSAVALSLEKPAASASSIALAFSGVGLLKRFATLATPCLVGMCAAQTALVNRSAATAACRQENEVEDDTMFPGFFSRLCGNGVKNSDERNERLQTPEHGRKK